MGQVSPYAGDWVGLPPEVMLKLWLECWGVSPVVIWGRADMSGAHCADRLYEEVSHGCRAVRESCAADRVEPLDEGVGRFAIRLTIVRKRAEFPESAADFLTKVGWFLRRVL